MNRYILFGDAQSPHLLKWGKELSKHVDLWVISGREFLAEWNDILSAERRILLPRNNSKVLNVLCLFPYLSSLYKHVKKIQPDWVNVHYLSSYGVLLYLTHLIFRLDIRIVASAWGSDILVTPKKSVLLKKLVSALLRVAKVTTSDSSYMASEMIRMGATKDDLFVFPFGLEVIPEFDISQKCKYFFFSNRGLSEIYDPFRVLSIFEHFWRNEPQSLLVIANDGELRPQLEKYVKQKEYACAVKFVGRLSHSEQVKYYKKSQFLISVPKSDSVSVSVLEGMSYACLPILSDLIVNHELVCNGKNGLIVYDDDIIVDGYEKLLNNDLTSILKSNYRWIKEYAFFPHSIYQFLSELTLRY